MRGYTRQIQPVVTLYPGYDPVTGIYLPYAGFSGYSGFSGVGVSGVSGYSAYSGWFSGYSGRGVPLMNASVRSVGYAGNEGFGRLQVLFSPSNPTPAIVMLGTLNSSGAGNWSVMPGSGGAVTAVESSLANPSELLPDLSNAGNLLWNTEALMIGGTNRYYIQGPVSMLRITGTGICYVLGE